MKIYKDARHELLNELNKDEVYADVLDFFETIME
jgi:alpha-beta hydrolase superfamily lysophospholipase